MRILEQVPNSVLWLFNGGETTSKNLKQETKGRGIDPGSLVFADKIPKAEHLARPALTNLDSGTRLVNGHTATSDSLSDWLNE